jgi:hypothetical protein
MKLVILNFKNKKILKTHYFIVHNFEKRAKIWSKTDSDNFAAVVLVSLLNNWRRTSDGFQFGNDHHVVDDIRILAHGHRRCSKVSSRLWARQVAQMLHKNRRRLHNLNGGGDLSVSPVLPVRGCSDHFSSSRCRDVEEW